MTPQERHLFREMNAKLDAVNHGAISTEEYFAAFNEWANYALLTREAQRNRGGSR